MFLCSWSVTFIGNCQIPGDGPNTLQEKLSIPRQETFILCLKDVAEDKKLLQKYGAKNNVMEQNDFPDICLTNCIQYFYTHLVSQQKEKNYTKRFIVWQSVKDFFSSGNSS